MIPPLRLRALRAAALRVAARRPAPVGSPLGRTGGACRVPSEHQLLVFWCQVLALLLAARALGGLARGLGQPSVIGELAAGVLLGPSVLGVVAPPAHAWLFPDDAVQRGLLAGLAWVGVFLLLVLTGMETDLALVRRLGRATARVAVGSLLVPLAAGVALGFALPAAFV